MSHFNFVRRFLRRRQANFLFFCRQTGIKNEADLLIAESIAVPDRSSLKVDKEKLSWTQDYSVKRGATKICKNYYENANNRFVLFRRDGKLQCNASFGG